jgi:transmembrane sensor
MTSEVPRVVTAARIDETAIGWVIRLSADTFSADEQAALDAWLASDVRHAAAFANARLTWANLEILVAEPGSLRDDLPPSRPRYFAPTLPGFVHFAAVTACAAIMIGTGTLWYGNPLAIMQADYRTAPGELRMVVLEDGSRVHLGPNSAIATRFDDRERRIELFSGVAAFAAVPERQAGNRPFVVEAANGEARALGTRFVVDRMPASVKVTVSEHRVRVSTEANASGASASAVIVPGQQVRYDAFGVGMPAQINIRLVTGWQRGRLIIDAAPLGDAVAQFNRYRRGRIMLAGEALATRKVSGVFDTRDIDGAVATIATELHLRSVKVGPLLTILY